MAGVAMGLFADPAIRPRVIDGIEDYLRRRSLESVGELAGRSRPNSDEPPAG